MAAHRATPEQKQRLSAIAARLRAGAAAGAPTPVDAQAVLSAFEQGQKRPFLQVAELVRTVNSGRGDQSLQQQLDKALDLNGRFRNLPKACRATQSGIPLRRQIAAIGPFFEFWNTFPDFEQFCRFFFERNLSRKRALAYPMLDKLYATHD
ncbi:MAG: hypothetical protein AB7O70_15650 [Hyphomicrobiales bacterium]